MATEKQIAANRENGKKSSGPRTKAGKAKVSQNALKHGLLARAALLPSEDGASFRAFADELLMELQPVGAVESLLADEIVNLAWRLQRASRVEAGLSIPRPSWRSWQEAIRSAHKPCGQRSLSSR